MVFASLIEYAIVGYYETSPKPENYNINREIITNIKETNDKTQQPVKRKSFANRLIHTINPITGKRDPSKIDKSCRWIFPLVFIVFNLFYWSINIYLNIKYKFKGMITLKDYSF